MDEVRDEQVTLGWILDGLQERSFGLVMLLLGLFALVPTLSTVVGFLLIWPGVQMVLARPSPTLPRWIARRPLSTTRFSRVIVRLLPVLRRMERIVRPRWRTPFESTKRVVGTFILLLGLTMLGPVPFSHVLPALVIMLVAFAYLEEDGVALSIALGVALVSFAITAVTVWGAVVGIEFLDRVG